MTIGYASRRGALLDQMEHQCLKPGEWLVEGAQVYRQSNGWWMIAGVDNGPNEAFPTFTAALEWVANYLEVK